MSPKAVKAKIRKKAKVSHKPTKRPNQCICIIHIPNIKHGEFVPLSEIKGVKPEQRLAYMQSVRDKRLGEPVSSPKRLTEVCLNIPDTVDNEEIEFTRYHSECYRKFTNRLENIRAPSVAQTAQQRPVRVPSTAAGSLFTPK